MTNNLIPQGYKLTDLGVIPEDWAVVGIEDEIGNVKSGKRLPKGNILEEVDNGKPYIRVTDMFMGGVNLSNIMYVPDKVFEFIENYRIYKDDVFISVAGTLGIVGCIPHELDGANLTENANRITNIKCDRNYLMYYLASDLIQNIIKSEQTIGAQPKLALGRIQQFQIALPNDIEEQQRIAEALRDIDLLIEGLKQKIVKKRAIKEGVMQQLLTGKKRLAGFSEPWVERRLGDVLDYEQPTNYLVQSSDYALNGTPVLTAGKTFILGYTNEGSGIYNNLPTIIFDDFTTASKLVYFPFKAKSSAMKILNLRTSEFSLKFIYEKMQTIDFPLSDHQRYWISEYSKLYISIPPTKTEQQAIAQILTDIDNEIAELEQKQKKYTTLKQGAMQKLLTGQIRLKM